MPTKMAGVLDCHEAKETWIPPMQQIQEWTKLFKSKRWTSLGSVLFRRHRNLFLDLKEQPNPHRSRLIQARTRQLRLYRVVCN